MKNYNDEIIKIAQEHAPSALAKSIEGYVSKAEEDKVKLDKALNELKELKSTNSILTKTVNDLNKTIDKYKNIEKREQLLIKGEAELHLNTELLKLKETHSNEKVELVKGVVHQVFSNNNIKRFIHNTGNYPVPFTSNGYGGTSGWVDNNTVETIEE